MAAKRTARQQRPAPRGPARPVAPDPEDVSPFLGWKRAPTGGEVAAALGPSAGLWERLVAALASDLGVDGGLWKSASAKAGWSLRLLRGERVVVYLIPRPGRFEVSFALGEAAREAARAARLPAAVRHALDAATKYAEGYGVRFRVTTDADVAAVLRLARAKLGT